MKNLFFITILTFIFSTLTFATPLLGIFDCEFGFGEEKVEEVMANKGWIASKKYNTAGNSFYKNYSKKSGTYGNIEVEHIQFLFHKNQLYKIVVLYKTTPEKASDIKDVAFSIQKKYNLKIINPGEVGEDMSFKAEFIDNNSHTMEYRMVFGSGILYSSFIFYDDILSAKQGKDEELEKQTKISDDL